MMETQEHSRLPIRGVPTHSLKVQFGFLAFIGIAAIIMLTIAGMEILVRVNKFFDENYFATHQAIEIKIQRPITIEKRENIFITPVSNTKPTDIMAENLLADIPEDKKDVAKAIVEKFGDHAALALSIARAESGLRYDALNYNPEDKSYDIGIFQINYQAHKAKPQCNLDKITTVEGNIECAYTIFKDQKGFNAWSAYQNGSYIAFYK